MTIKFFIKKKKKRKRDLSFSDKRCEKREKYGWMGGGLSTAAVHPGQRIVVA
jgi:hypothetical protein